MIKLIYIGEKFYMKSGTVMGVLYEIDKDAKWHRRNWASVERALREGKAVNIVPANKDQLAIAEAWLQDTYK